MAASIVLKLAVVVKSAIAAIIEVEDSKLNTCQMSLAKETAQKLLYLRVLMMSKMLL